MPFVRSLSFGRIAIVVWCLLAYISPAAAFFPTAWRQQHFGKHGISHEQQTAEAFEVLAALYWPQKVITRAMSEARVAIASANADVDRDWDHSAFHCDGENFDGAQARLSELKKETISKLKDGKATDAQKALGSALHTLQDFYSHSNWIEMGNTEPHPDFGTGRKMVYAHASNATCAVCGPTVQKDRAGCPLCVPVTNSTMKFAPPGQQINPMDTSTEMLTSGYAFGEDSPLNKTAGIPEFKCHHGGHIDSPRGAGIGFILGMVRGDSIPGINKDSLDCGFSPHAHLHMAAVNASIKATIRYVDDIKQQLNDTQLRMLFGTGSTLAFAVDTTAVLKPITASIKSHTIKIVEQDLHVPEAKEANQYVVRAFNSGSNTVTTQTSDIEHFKSTINKLGDATVRGRDACAGLSLSGILDTLKLLDDGSTLFLMAGAYPPDDSLATEIISLAYAKDITIHSFHYRGGCMNDYVRLRASFKMKSVYDSFAAATGGLSYGQGVPQFQLSQSPKNGRLNQRGENLGYLHGNGHAGNQSAVGGEGTGAMDMPKISFDVQSSIQNKGDGAPILNIADAFTRTGQKSTYSFPVDTTISELKIALVSKATSITLIQPNGSPLTLPDDPKANRFNPPQQGAPGNNGGTSVTSTTLENGHFITLARPALGTWKLVVHGTGAYKVNVYATTTLHLHSFTLSKLEGRQGHEGYFPVLDSVKLNTGEDVSLVAEIRGPFRSGGSGSGATAAAGNVKFEFKDAKGNSVLIPEMKAGTGKLGEANVNLFFGMGKVGGSSFFGGSWEGKYLVYVTGKDESGREFQRVWGTEVEAVG
ncbi:hypothetical protein EG327_001885 [Venturia inaequalis]|uniref:Uncharacterized protein n=1 Tax=Venturia inaequalis TaxID=5025 RepID=A0A8H3VJ37_VENIN|nr:hypothetical protein EG327_001885 [Venturia inaequalis]